MCFHDSACPHLFGQDNKLIALLIILSSHKSSFTIPATTMHFTSFLDAFIIISITLPTVRASVSPQHYIVPAYSAIHPRLKAERSFRLSGRSDCCDIGCDPDCSDGTICVENDDGDTGCCPEGDFLCNGGDFICCPEGTSCQGTQCVS